MRGAASWHNLWTFSRGCQFLPRGVGFRVSGTYLVVGHIFFDDHFDMREEGVLLVMV